jgi:hypothetical protein
MKEPEIAPPRGGVRGAKEFLIKEFSKLCDRCASVVNTSSQETQNKLKNKR